MSYVIEENQDDVSRVHFMIDRLESVNVCIGTDIKFRDHDYNMTGNWYTIEYCDKGGIRYYLLEHEEHGDELPCIIVNHMGQIVVEEAYNGLEELEY